MVRSTAEYRLLLVMKDSELLFCRSGGCCDYPPQARLIDFGPITMSVRRVRYDMDRHHYVVVGEFVWDRVTRCGCEARDSCCSLYDGITYMRAHGWRYIGSRIGEARRYLRDWSYTERELGDAVRQ